jgi:hypothetical protein
MATTSRSSDEGIRAALRALKARHGPASEADRPRPSTFPGHHRAPLEGQLSIGDELAEATEAYDYWRDVDDVGEDDDEDRA